MTASSQILEALETALAPVVARERKYRNALGMALVLLAMVPVVLFGDRLGLPRTPVPFVCMLLFLVFSLGLLVHWLTHAREPDYAALARVIEQRHPDLQGLLLTAIEQKPAKGEDHLNFLQQRVMWEALAKTREHGWLDAVPGWRIWAAIAMAWVFFALNIVAFRQVHLLEATSRTPAGAIALDQVVVQPGDATLEKGSSLIVTARFPSSPPSEASLLLQPTTGAAQRIVLRQNLGDPIFGGALAEVNQDLTYHIDYAGHTTRDFHVRVFEFPRMERADAHLTYPEYTKLPEKQIPDTKRVTAVEGTKIDLSLQLNKPVKSAALVAKDGTTIPLTVDGSKPVAELRGHIPLKSQSYEVRLEDEEGRASKVPGTFAMDVVPNRKPEIKIAAPKGDQRVSPLQEVAFQTTVWDDFGLSKYGVTYTVADGATKEVKLGENTTTDQRLTGNHVLKLEDLAVEPDQLISWFAWAEDIGPDGKPRRTASDIYFAEVRPFEEIFRQDPEGASGQQQQSGGGAGGGAGEEAQKLGEVQKQVITATWNLKRSEDGAVPGGPSEKYRKDEPVVLDGQKKALDLAGPMREKLEDPAAQALADKAIRAMERAAGHLERAATSVEPLPEALEAEQAAYNALLKLSAHEFRVSRSKNQKGNKAGQSRQRQLNQLDLKDEKERYETQKEATPQEKTDQKQQLAVLNRLKELAQRQQDINERVKELQTALQEAKTETAKEELRKQLKRLQEDEQQLLGDVDELQQKMQQDSDPSRLADERKQLDETRAEAQKAGEALQKESPSEALASGTRAERDLQKLRDDVRKKSSAQFNDQMRQMRSDARELADTQKELGEKLAGEAAGENRNERKTLDGSNPREELAANFDRQQERLKGLQDKMRGVSDEAEVAEPLLAKELYDALRKNSQAGTDEKLKRTGQLARRGYASEARQTGDKATKEIDELKTGVERAAESVLGNEEESLRQARAELDALAHELNREIAQAAPDLADKENGDQQGAQGAQDGQNGDGKNPSDEKGGKPRGSGKNGEQAGDQRTAQEGAGQRPGEQKGAGDPSEKGEQGAGTGDPQQGQDQRQAQGRGQGQRQQQGQGQRGQGQGQRDGQQNGGDQQGQTAEGGQQDGQQPGQQAGQAGKRTAQRNGGRGQGQGNQPGQDGAGQDPQDSAQNAQGQQPGQGQQQGQGQQAGRGQGQQAGQGQQQGQGQGRGGAQTASNQRGGQGGDQNPDSANPQGANDAQRPGANLRNLTASAPRQRGGILDGGGGGGGNRGGGIDQPEGPIRGDSFVQWSDRLRNVEEMVDDPALRTEIAKIRETARGVRADLKRHAEEPKWDMIKTQIGKPLAEVRDRVSEELARRTSRESLVPIDRDPVPPKYADQVQRYYEVLGSDGKTAPKP